MKKCLLVFFVFTVSLSCNTKNKKSSKLSIIIRIDSIAIFYGQLDSTIVVKNCFFDSISIEKILLNEKNKADTGFSVIIKPTPCSDIIPKTLSLRKLLAKNSINNSTTMHLTDFEKVYFQTESFEDVMFEINNKSNNPVKNKKTSINAIFLKIEEDKSLWIKYSYNMSIGNYEKVKSNSVKDIIGKLDSVTAKYGIDLEKTKLNIVGSASAKYGVFKNVIDALKQKEKMDFDIITN